MRHIGWLLTSWLPSLVFDYVIYFDQLFDHNLDEWDHGESDIDRDYEHKFVPACLRDDHTDDNLSNGRAEGTWAIDDTRNRRLRSLTGLEDLVLTDIGRTRGRDDVVQSADYETEEKQDQW